MTVYRIALGVDSVSFLPGVYLSFETAAAGLRKYEADIERDGFAAFAAFIAPEARADAIARLQAAHNKECRRIMSWTLQRLGIAEAFHGLVVGEGLNRAQILALFDTALN